MADFKRLSDVEVVAESAESANVLIEENGVIKKTPKTSVGVAGGGTNIITYVCKESGGVFLNDVQMTFDTILADWEAGYIQRIKFENSNNLPRYGTIVGFDVEDTSDGYGYNVCYTDGPSIHEFQWWT